MRSCVCIAVLGILILWVGTPAFSADLTCPTSTTLESLVTCIRAQMPAAGSNNFIAPSSTEQTDYRTAVRRMLQGECGFALPTSLNGIMQIRNFTDSENGRTYCVLMEILDSNNNGIVDRAWGTFITYQAATRQISHQSPHPISDSTTELQAIGIFKATDSRSFLLAGARRDTSSAASACQPSYFQTDVAHNTGNMFHAANIEINGFYGTSSWNAIQWHGMAADTCTTTEVYLSHGRNQTPAPADKITLLRSNLLKYHPAWQIDLPGAGACTQTGTDNVQGRFLNGVAAGSVCDTAATSYSGKFIHIEQDPGFRTASDWIAAVKDTWPITGPPAAPSTLTATGAKRKINLSWTASAGATSYNLKRSLVSGGPYTVIRTGITATSYTDSGLSSGTNYWYVVSASNTAGESPNSIQAGARAK